MSTPAVIAATLTALLMVAVGAFWMLAWLLGANGYGTGEGGIILGGNAVLALAGLVGAAWLARALTLRWQRIGWPAWGAGALAVAVAMTLAIFAMGLGSLAIIIAVEILR